MTELGDTDSGKENCFEACKLYPIFMSLPVVQKITDGKRIIFL